jgi:hypothetical protein
MGAGLEFPDQPPTREEVIASEDGHRRLAGYLIRRQADLVTNTSGQSTCLLHFKH